MIVRKEKYYIKKVNIIDRHKNYDTQKIRRTIYLFLGLIPIFINYEVVGGEYEK